MRSLRRQLSISVGLAMACAGLPLVIAPLAQAAPVCTGSANAGQSVTCDPSGSGYVSYTVPAHVTSINVTADGGGGGRNASLGRGGAGARISATFSVVAGDVLRVYVGAGGRPGLGGNGNVGGNGYGVGGNGAVYWGADFGSGYGGGGGGSSAVLLSHASGAFNPIIVVGGGGGGGGTTTAYGGSAYSGSHTSSGSPGAAGGGDGTCSMGGGGGNTSGSGSAGTSTGTGNPGASTSGYAGKGGNGVFGAGGLSSAGGGGGGGYGGGGAGNWQGPQNGCINAGGGGGGGSFLDSTKYTGTPVFNSASNGGINPSAPGGDGSVSISFVAPTSVPDPVTNLVFTDVTSTSMKAYWTPPAYDGSSVLLGYDVTVNGGTATRTTDAVFALTGLTPSTSYTVEVKAVNAVGSSTGLSASQTTTAPAVIVPCAPTSMVFSSVTSIAITLSWTAPVTASGCGNTVLGYQVQVDGGTRTWTTSLTYTADFLTPDSVHSFNVFAVNGIGSSAALNGTRSTGPTVPDPPTALTFSAVTSTSITASWTAPVNTGGSALIHYFIAVDGGASVQLSPTTTTYTATGLSSSTWHDFSVTAQNSQGTSNALEGSQSTSAAPGTAAISTTASVVGEPATAMLTGYPGSSTQTVFINAPDGSTTSTSVAVDSNGDGTLNFTPSMDGTYTLSTSPISRSASSTASSTPSDSAASLPPSIVYGIPTGYGACPQGWSRSWVEWANGVACEIIISWNSPTQSYLPDPARTLAEGLAWTASRRPESS